MFAQPTCILIHTKKGYGEFYSMQSENAALYGKNTVPLFTSLLFNFEDIKCPSFFSSIIANARKKSRHFAIFLCYHTRENIYDSTVIGSNESTFFVADVKCGLDFGHRLQLHL